MSRIFLPKSVCDRIEAHENAAALYGRLCRDYDGWICWSSLEDAVMIHTKPVGGSLVGAKTIFVRNELVVTDEQECDSSVAQR